MTARKIKLKRVKAELMQAERNTTAAETHDAYEYEHKGNHLHQRSQAGSSQYGNTQDHFYTQQVGRPTAIAIVQTIPPLSCGAQTQRLHTPYKHAASDIHDSLGYPQPQLGQGADKHHWHVPAALTH
jgi:hypothetical protein